MHSHSIDGSRRGSSWRFAAFAFLAFVAAGGAGFAQEQEALQALHNHVRSEVTTGKARPAGAMPLDTQLTFSIVLPLRNETELDQLLTRLYDPSSPDYRQFLTVAEFTEKFGPSAEDYAAVVRFAQASGFEMTAPPAANRLVIPLRGTVDAINNAFHVRMSLYAHPTENRTFFSPDREPSLGLSVPVAHIAGLNNYSLPKPMVSRPNAVSGAVPATGILGSGPQGSYLGSDMRAAYYGGTQLRGDGQAIGLVEWGGYYISDVNLTFSSAKQSYTVPVNNVLLDGAIAEPVEGDDDVEQVLDIVQAIGMAPGLSQVRVYIGNGNDDANVLNSMASENIAKVLSCSWSWLPDDPGTDDVFFKEMAAQGQSFLAASGDYGAFDVHIDPYFYPGEDDYVTAVGGTHLVTESAGGPWSSETAWNAYGAGSGGGVSPDGILLPSWQSGLATAANGGSTKYRNVPDVAMEGDFDNFACDIGQCNEGWAGTSFAAPRWAGFVALVNQQAVEAGTAAKGGIGFLNPALYSIGEGSNTVTDFHDIVSGNNDTEGQPVWYNAVTGYDLVTGWGSPTGQDLINDLAGKQAPGFWLQASSPTVEMNPGASGKTTIDVVGAGGFTGNVQLAVTSALPTGVTAKWSTNPTSGSSVLTITAASTAANTTTKVTIKGTSGSTTEATSIMLTVHTPSFSLSTMPGGVRVNPGGSVGATVVVTPLYGFTGSVKLAVSGLPTGVTATLGTNPTTGTSTLTLKASSTTATGTSTVTITGISGSAAAKTTLVLSVHPPTMTLFNSGNVNMGAGTSATTYIFVAGDYGFNGSVDLSVSGLPSGVTASFAPNPTTNYSVLTLKASSTTALGTSTLTVTGTSGSLKSTTSFKLNILAPTFTILANNSVGIGQGTTTTSQVSVFEEYGFSSGVRLAISGLPSGVTGSFSPNPTTGYSLLTLTASSTAPLGSSTVTITGTSGTLKETASFTLGVYVPTFTLSTGGLTTLGQGSSATANVSVTPEYGFMGSVKLAVSGLPAGVTASATPNPVTGTAQLMLTATSSAPVGNSTVTVTGTSGTQTAKTTLPLTIVKPTFTVAASGQVNLGAGSSATTTVNVAPEYGFLGSVHLALSGLPSGVTSSFSPNPSTGSSILTLYSTGTAALGKSTITLTGTSGTQSAKTTFPLTVAAPGFTLFSQGELDLGPGTSTSANVGVNPVNGFTGTVHLTISGLPTGVTASFDPALVTGGSVLTLTAANTVTPGTSTITITGTWGTKTEKTTFPLKVGEPTFTIQPVGSLSLNQGQAASVYLTVKPLYGFTGSVNFVASGLPVGVTASFSPNPSNQGPTMTLTVSNTATVGTSTVTVKGTWGSKASSVTFPLTVTVPSFALGGPGQMQLAPGSTTTGTISVSAGPGFSGSVKLAIAGLPSGVTAAFSPNPMYSTGGGYNASTLTLTAASTAVQRTTTLTVTGTSGTLKATTTISLQVHAPAFTIGAPLDQALAPGGTATSTVSVNPEFGFARMVKLAASGLPAGVTATFSPNPAPPGYASLTLTASSTAALATKTVTITGTSGSQTSSTTFQLNVAPPHFTLGDSSVTMEPGATGTSSVWINWQNGSGGNVNLSVSGLPSGVTGSFSPASANSGSTLTLTATSMASLGQYNAVIKGTWGSETATVPLNITIEPASISIGIYQGLQLGRGSSTGGTVYIGTPATFSGSVHLSAVGLPTGVTATFSPNPSTQSSLITLTASSTAVLGEYNATLVGTSGTQTVRTPISVTVYAPTFTLSGDNASLTPGSSTQASVYVEPQHGFTGSVNLSVSGLPSGVTGTFLPTPATDQSILTLTANSSVAPGQHNVTITGVCGNVAKKFIMPLTIGGNNLSLSTYGLSVGQGSSASTWVDVNSTNTLFHPVQLSATGLPSGVTASFSPNPTLGQTTVTVTATSTASLGEYAVTLTAVGGGQKATTQMPVAIAAPSFTLSAPYQPSLGQGGSFSGTVSIYPQYGFNGAVKLSVTGLPSGVVASFTPNPTANSSSMTLTASSTVPAGQYNMNLMGTSGTQTATSPFTLFIGAPSFTVSSSGSASLGQGTSTTTYVNVNPSFGFNSAVNLSISGLPTGVTGSFSPNPTTGQSTLSLTATSTATTGVHMATITGTSGSMKATTPLSITVGAPRFSLNGESAQVGQGSSTTAWVYVESSFGFTGNVQLAATGLPSGVTASFSPNPTTYSSSMTLTASSTVAPGQYNFTIKGTSGSLSASTIVQLTVYTPTFTIYASPATVGQGTTATSSVNVSSQYGFSGSVQLAITGLPSGVTASFSPNPTGSTSTLTLTATSTAALGQYNATITGTFGNQTTSTTTTVTVYAPTFTLSGPYSDVIVGRGTSVQTSVSVNPQYGFAGNVQLAVSGLPSGVTASFSQNPATTGSTLTLTASSTATLGEYNIIVTGTSGSQKATTNFTVGVYTPSFTLSAGNSVNIGQGTTATSSIYVSADYGFSGSVKLAASGLPSGVTASFSPNPTNSGSTLTLTASGTAPTGLYNVTVTGTFGSEAASTSFILGVYVPTFTVSTTTSLNMGEGTTATTYVSVGPEYGFTGSVKLAVSGLPSGVTASFSPNPVTGGSNSVLTLVASGTAPTGQYAVTIKGTSGKQAASTTFTLGVYTPSFSINGPGNMSIGQGTQTTAYMSVSSEYGFSGSVNLTASGLPSGVTASFSPNPTTGSSILTLIASSAAPLGQYTVTVTGSSGSQTVSSTFTLSVYVPTFTLYGPYSISMGQGTATSTSISVNPEYGFSGSVKLTASGLPSGVTALFSPNPATSNSTLTLKASSTASTGTYTVTVTGTSGSQTASTTFSVSVYAPTFMLYGPYSVSMGQGTTTTTSISVNPQYGFSGSVKLVASGQPTGITASFSPNPTTGSSTLTLAASGTAPPGTYTVTVTGTSGSQAVSATFSLGVYAPTFTVGVWGNVSMGQGATVTTNVSVNPEYGFAGSVKLAASGLPSGVTASFSPNPTTGSSTLTLTASGTAPTGTYTITVTGTSGSQTASATFSLSIYMPTFTLAIYSGVNLGQGTSGTASVYLNPEYGFSGSVSLAVSGLPSGVTASFSPNPTTGNSTLTLTASSTAAVGQYTAKVTGTSGSQTVSAAITVGVYVPTFTVLAGYSATIGQGTATTVNVSVNPEYGFTGSVKLAASGLPSGVTASFSPNPATGNSTLTLTASSTAALGQYTVTVTGTSGSKIASTTFSLGVYVPTFTLSDYYVPTLSAGTSVVSWVYIADEYGFDSGVKLAVSGLPSGVTASFSPNPATSISSEMTLTAGSAVTAGQYTLTITGTSGTQKVTTTATLTVN